MTKPFQARALLLAAALAGVPLAAAAASQVGVNAAIRNSVQEKASSAPSYRPAIARGPVSLGDTVVSGPNSALQVLLLDRSIFTVGANARVAIDRFVYDPGRKASDVALSVAKGSFRFMSGPTLAGQGRNVINTPVSSIGVRGTILEGAVGPDVAAILEGQPGAPAISGAPDGATLVVLRGPGLFAEGFDKTGAIDVTSDGVTVTLTQPGQAALLLPGQPPIVFWLSNAASARLAGLLLGAPTGPGQPGLVNGSVRAASGDAPIFVPLLPPGAQLPTSIPPVPTKGGPNSCGLVCG